MMSAIEPLHGMCFEQISCIPDGMRYFYYALPRIGLSNAQTQSWATCLHP
jgi:hypothetical protein